MPNDSSSLYGNMSMTMMKDEKGEQDSAMDVMNTVVETTLERADAEVAVEEEDTEKNKEQVVMDMEEASAMGTADAFEPRQQLVPEDEAIASALPLMDGAPNDSDNVRRRDVNGNGVAAGAQIFDDVRILVAGVAATAVLSVSFVALTPKPNLPDGTMQQSTEMQQSMGTAISDDNGEADEVLLAPGIQMMMKATQPSAEEISSNSNTLTDIVNGRGGIVRDVLMVSLVIAALASAFGGLEPASQDEETRRRRRGAGERDTGGAEFFDVEAKRRELLRTLELDSPSPPSYPPSSPRERRSSSSADASPSGRGILSGSACMPHPLKRDTGGEDASFILLSEKPKSGADDDASSSRDRVLGVIGVADGVSAWVEDGVDAGTYSRKLMANARQAAVSMMKKDSVLQFGGAETEAETSRKALPLQSLVQAQDKTREEGSCCALVYAVSSGADEKTMRMDVTSVGDCGLRVIRGGDVVYVSKVQEHSFNRPYQLGSEKLFPGCDIAAKSAVTEVVDLQVGDAIVAGSDGLFDNLFDKDIVAVMSEFTSRRTYTKESAKRAATLIADIAARNSVDSSYRSPFAVEVASKLPNGGLPLWRRALGQQYAGGKTDDITVVVTFVV